LDTFCIYKALPFRDVMEYEIKRREEREEEIPYDM
jgi:hypothetical protein